MRYAFCSFLLVVVVGASVAWPGDGPAEEKRLAGYWSASVKIGAAELPYVLYQKKDVKGGAAWYLDSPAEEVSGLPATASKFVDGNEPKLTVQFDQTQASFTATLSKDGTELHGEWDFQSGKFPATMKHTGTYPNRPQEPKGPFPYRSEEVSYENVKAKVHLAGTLTLPKGDGPFPAAILITGSGTLDRDEEVYGHKPFLLIADYLTRRGVAVLRVDDRGIGGSTGSTPDSTSADFAEDVLTGVAYLKGRKDIDPRHIGLIGHSEGGLIGPMVATQSADIAFVVMLAGPGYRGDEILFQQNKLLMEAAGAPKEAVAFQLKALASMFEILRTEKDNQIAEQKVFAQLAAWKGQAGAIEKAMIEGKESPAGKERFRELTTPWYRYFLTKDPAPVLRQVKCPVLALNGDKDLQVACDLNLAAVAKALKDGGNKDVTTRALPNLNHFFQTARTGLPVEYGLITETMAPAVLETTAEWITARTGLKE